MAVPEPTFLPLLVTFRDSVVMLMEGFFWVVAVLAPQRRLRPAGWLPSVSLFVATAPLATEEAAREGGKALKPEERGPQEATCVKN